MTVSLSAGVVGTGRGGDAEGDILTGVEGVVGSDEDDELDATGNARVDYLFGRAGDDLLQGGDPVAGDYLDGEEGNDHLRMQSGGILMGGAGADVFELYGASCETRDRPSFSLPEAGGRARDGQRAGCSVRRMAVTAPGKPATRGFMEPACRL